MVKKQKTKRKSTLFARIQKENHVYLMKNYKNKRCRSASDFVDKIVTRHRRLERALSAPELQAV